MTSVVTDPASNICDSRPRRTSYAEIVRMLCTTAISRVKQEKIAPKKPVRKFTTQERNARSEFLRLKKQQERIEHMLARRHVRIKSWGSRRLEDTTPTPQKAEPTARLQMIARMRTDTVLALVGKTAIQARHELERLRARLEKI